MSNARLRLAFASRQLLEGMSWGSSWALGEPPGSPSALSLVRFAYKALRAFPTPLHAHEPQGGS